MPSNQNHLRTQFLNSLLSYLDIGSFPTRRCIYRILRTAFCDKSFNETLLSVSKKDFIKNLVHNIGAFYLGSGVTNTAEVDSSKTALLGLGDFRSYVCCEEVCLMRTLQRSPLWSSVVDSELEIYLQEDSPLELIAGSFAVLGGNFECVRVGGRVKLVSKDNLDSASSATAAGVVVHIDRVNGTALVAFNVSIDLIPEKVNLEDLISIDEVLPYNVDVENPGKGQNFSRLLHAIERFIITNPENESSDYSHKILQCMAAKCLKYLVHRVSELNASIDVFRAVIDYASRQLIKLIC